MNNCDELKYLTWTGDYFWRYTEYTFWPRGLEPGEVRIDLFLPLTEDSKSALCMLYPNFPISRLEKALQEWELFKESSSGEYGYCHWGSYGWM